MRRGAFTLIEVMIVVAIIGMLAAATAWSMTGDLKRSSLESVIGQLTHADHSTRLAARSLGKPCVLRFDLDAQSVRRVSDAQRLDGSTPAVVLSGGFSVSAFAAAGGDEGEVDIADAGKLKRTSGVGEVAISSTGRSRTYGLRVTGRDGHYEGWLILSGLTGQATWIHDEDEADNLFATLATGGADAH